MIINYIIFTGLSGIRDCTIYSPSVTANAAMISIPSRTQNVILYCICTRNAINNRPVAVGPITWFIDGTAVTLNTTDGSGNPYYRNNVPSPLIIPLFTATHAGTYGCEGPEADRVTINLAGMCN